MKIEDKIDFNPNTAAAYVQIAFNLKLRDRYFEALNFARKMHLGQLRKYTGEPYITHPIEVADLVETYLSSIARSSDCVILDAVLIAILHDTVEDTEATIEDIEETFGSNVAKGVWFLTKTPSFIGNRRTRKSMDESRLSKAPNIVKIIKAFDMLHNRRSIKKYDPKFYKVFEAETKSLLKAMGIEVKNGIPFLVGYLKS